MNTQLTLLLKVCLYFTVLILLSTSASSLQAQSRKYLRSHEYMTQLEALDTTIVAKRAALETTIQQTYTSITVPVDPVIPIIFHVLYQNEQQRVSEQQLLAQVEALNRDFGLENSGNFTHQALERENFNSTSERIGLRFCLPQLGGDSTAINYYSVNQSTWQFDNAMKDPARAGVRPWNPQQFLNVYVVDLHDTLAVAGYAQMPEAADSTDAIVLDYRFVAGSDAPYDLGRTLVHLVGNWLGLYSIWGEYPCDPRGDRVYDTPNHNAPNLGCPPYRHVSTCYQKKLVTEQTMNFMDSSDDACVSMWTTGQKYRLFACLQATRSGVLQHNYTCLPTSELLAESEARSTEARPLAIILSDQVQVFPNPSNDYVQVALDLKNSRPVRIELSDLTGKRLFEKTNVLPTETVPIKTTAWQSGIYILTVSQNGQTLHAEKLAIQH
ncbi:MAG: zinc-dependent metalloprotease [Bacteroidota bacterium]